MLYLIDLTLPLQDPILIFAIILFIILFAPIILNRFRIPHLIGLIIAGVFIGTKSLNLVELSSIELFSNVGLLYIMFLAGLELDMEDFKKNSGKSLVFGLSSFGFPMLLSFLLAFYFYGDDTITSILFASMISSHTLITYPIVSKLGIAKNRAVNVAVGGTIITDAIALLILAAIIAIHSGNAGMSFWVQLFFMIVALVVAVMTLFPIVARWFFKRNDDSISQYIFVLALVFTAAFAAHAINLEGIIGAFLAGMALNKLIPHTSALMNRIEFVGNALFIPFFLIGVGMRVDYRAFIGDIDTIIIAVSMTSVAVLSKFLGATFTQKIFKYNNDERNVMFGLSNSQAAATLAVVIIGVEMGLFKEAILNGAIVMILITCTIASFVTQKSAKNIALAEAGEEEPEGKKDSKEERILIPLANVDNVDKLIALSVTIKSKKNKDALFALNIINNNKSGSNAEKEGRKILEKAKIAAAATDNNLEELLRYDSNIATGIYNTVKEKHITDLILGLHQKQNISDSFLGALAKNILNRCNVTTFIYRPIQPIATLKRHVIIIPEGAEHEIGFPFWLVKVWNIARNSGSALVFYAHANTLELIKNVNAAHPVNCEFNEFSEWEDFLILSRNVKSDDNLMIIMSRPNHPSYNSIMERIPNFLNKYFQNNSFMLIYPVQIGLEHEKGFKDVSIINPYQDLENITNTITHLFKRK